MALDLQTLLDKAAEGSTEKQRTAAVAKALEGANRGDLDALLGEVTDKFSALADTDPTAEDEVLGLEYLAAVAVAAKSAQEAADQRVDEIRAKRAELAAKVLGDTTDTAAVDDTEGAEDAAEQGDDTSTDTTEADTTEGAVEATEVTEAATVDAAPVVEAVAEPVAVAASAGKRFNLANIKQKAPAPVKPPVTITASADVSGYSGGQHLDYDGLVAAATSKIEAVTRAGVNTSGSIAQVHLDFPDHLVASGANDADVIEAAVDQSKLSGGSIVAAGGWCAPSEVIYDLVDLLADTKTGLISVPEIQAKRGGIKTASNLDFSTVWAGNAGLIQTEEQANEDPVPTKQFFRPVCPTFSETRADAFYSGISVGFLHENAYPETVKQAVDGVMAVHAHRLNASTISRMEAASTAVNLTGLGPSAAGSTLNGIGLLITDFRYRHRAPETLTLEVILPIWLKEVVRSDLALRAGDGQLIQVTDQQITAYFTARGAKVQWVYDWQDAFTGVSGGFGSATAITAFPATVKALVYPAGTFVRLRGQVINIETVYDKANIEKNDYLKLFTEEKLGVHKRAFSSAVATLPLGVRGATGTGEVLDNQGKPV